MNKVIKVSIKTLSLNLHQNINIVLSFRSQSVSLKEVLTELSSRYGNWVMDLLTEDGHDRLNRSLTFIMNGNMLNFNVKAEEHIITDDADICILNVIDGG